MESYRPLIEQKIADSIEAFGPKSTLRDAVEYALTNGGKRLRPAIVFAVANELGSNQDVSDAALAVEFFHTASLIADDLPCMDNDDFRRGKPSLHKAFGEATAILATYALISEGYERIRKAAQQTSFDVMQLAFAYATKNTGIRGATGGQYLDLYDPQSLEEIIQKKTGTLFELAFVLGWLFGGGELSQLPAVEKLAADFGLAFQVRDDLEDTNQDTQEKNFALKYGIAASKITLLDIEMQVKEGLISLGLKNLTYA